MDCCYNCFTLFAWQIVKQFADWPCHERVETRCWFIKDDDARVRNKLDSNWETLFLAIRENFFVFASDPTVSYVTQSKITDNLLDTIVLILNRDLQLESSGESKSLGDSESSEKNVILLYIAAKPLKSMFGHWNLIVKEHVSRNPCRSSRAYSVSQYVYERSFSRTWRAHNISCLTRRRVAWNTLENLKFSRLTPSRVCLTLGDSRCNLSLESQVLPRNFHW